MRPYPISPSRSCGTPQWSQGHGHPFFQRPGPDGHGKHYVDRNLKQDRESHRKIANKIENRIETLSTRKLSFRGKAVLANSLLLSKAWHARCCVQEPYLSAHQLCRKSNHPIQSSHALQVIAATSSQTISNVREISHRTAAA